MLAILDHVHLHRVDVDADVLADHFQQFALQQRQVVRAGAVGALLGDDDAQAVLGDGGGVLLGLQEIEHSHASTPEDLAEEALLRSEENTSELQSLMRNSYAVFCLKKK